jgi:protein-tyrosine phosphatase
VLADQPAPPEAIRWFLEELRARYGSVASYVGRAGVTDAQVEALRAHLLD